MVTTGAKVLALHAAHRGWDTRVQVASVRQGTITVRVHFCARALSSGLGLLVLAVQPIPATALSTAAQAITSNQDTRNVCPAQQGSCVRELVTSSFVL